MKASDSPRLGKVKFRDLVRLHFFERMHHDDFIVSEGFIQTTKPPSGDTSKPAIKDHLKTSHFRLARDT